MKNMWKLLNSKFMRYWIGAGLIIGLVAVICETFIIPVNNLPKRADVEDVLYSEFEEKLNNKQIECAYYSESSKYIYYVSSEDSKMYRVYNIATESLDSELALNDVVISDLSDLEFAEYKEDNRRTYMIFALGFMFLLFCINYSRKNPNKGVAASVIGEDSGVAGTTGEKIKPNKTGKTFDDIAGLVEVKKDMKCLVDFLVNKDKYISAGATLPKGIILYGPPGTGKTLLAKAVAGEANVNFIYASGSDFVEMYVGVGAKRIRELFQKAKKLAPCIIFIDEIDAMGGKRSSGNENSEDRKTLNALLTEMDGFNETENILVVAATNRIDDLDQALLREGRFTNKYCVPLPETSSERRAIIDIYVKNKRLAEDVDLDGLAKETIGFSPAKIESLLNEAAIISVQNDSHFITKEHLESAMCKILLRGHQREDQSERDAEELRIVAYHESGHAIIGKLVGKEIPKVTILSSTSGAGGYTLTMPFKHNLLSKRELEQEVMSLYGGRVAERIYFNNDRNKVTTGASNDIDRANSILNEYITKYGMIEKFGLVTLSDGMVSNEFVFNEKVDLSKQLEDDTYDLLMENKDKLVALANMLLERETIHEEELDEIMGISKPATESVKPADTNTNKVTLEKEN
jgi:cell division protease FtsH